MYPVNQITDDANQTQNLIFPDGSQMSLTMIYKPQQYGWFLNLVYGTFVLNGIRLCNSPNLLRQYKNQITFGICCQVIGWQEPTLISDFVQGRAQLFVLSAAEVQAYEDFLSGNPA